MKLVLLTLLLLVCTSQVLTLTCYVCTNENDKVCATELECPKSSNYCVTVESEGEISSRTCEANCPSGPYTTCCNEDLC
ncbi:unnamed protein product [Tetraodon nigroviridis]|uniref:(spotted green pufferfish) hypothetical protein n=1 Tax=Tetraodon nigroviridis TaxID=99883 RepID=Q4T653_TETNG|nr:unnamed protein product [Tetraodon nigroviridis]